MVHCAVYKQPPGIRVMHLHLNTCCSAADRRLVLLTIDKYTSTAISPVLFVNVFKNPSRLYSTPVLKCMAFVICARNMKRLLGAPVRGRHDFGGVGGPVTCTWPSLCDFSHVPRPTAIDPRAWAVLVARNAGPAPAEMAGRAGSEPTVISTAESAVIALGCSLVRKSSD